MARERIEREDVFAREEAGVVRLALEETEESNFTLSFFHN